MKKSKWEEEFDKRSLGGEFAYGNNEQVTIEFPKIKAFIKQVEQTTRQETIEGVVKELEKALEEYHGGGTGRRLLLQLISNCKALKNLKKNL